MDLTQRTKDNSKKKKTVPKEMVFTATPPHNLDAEKALLGGIMLDPGAMDVAKERLDVDCFYDSRHQLIFRAMEELSATNRPITIITVCEQLSKMERLEDAGGRYFVVTLENNVVNAVHNEHYARIIKEKFISRSLIRMGGEFVQAGYDAAQDPFEYLDQAENKIYSIAAGLNAKTYSKIVDGLIPALNEINEMKNAPDDKLSGVPSGFYLFDKLTHGWQNSNLIILAARPAVGKCLGKGTRVLMYDGSLKNVEDIQVGELLMGDDSTPRKVLSLARGRQMMYTVRQVRGITYRVNESHIMSLMASRNQGLSKHGDKIDIPLDEYLRKSRKFQNNWKGYKTAVEFPKKETTIPPYLLGLWLGDGSAKSPQISKPDIEVEEYLQAYADGQDCDLRINAPATRCKNYSLVKRKGSKLKPFITQLRELNLFGNKHIPANFLINSRENRLQLLAGLIDTDGYLIPTGGYEILQKDENLIRQIKFLADTLGFRTSLNAKVSTIASIGFTGNYFRLTIFGDIHNIPVRIRRKQWAKAERYRDHLIAGLKIEKDVVDNYFGFVIDGNRRFLLEDGTVTHNTAFALNLARNAAKAGFPVGLFSLEMSMRELIQRLLSTESEIAYDKIRKGRLDDEEDRQLFTKGIQPLSTLELYVDDTPNLSIFDLKSRARRMVKKHGIKMFIVDYLQLVTAGDSKGMREQEISLISRNLKGLAKQLKIPIIALSQLSRETEKRADKTPQLADLRESGAIEQDADVVIFIYRPDYYDIKHDAAGKSTRNITEFKFAKNRGGITDTVKLTANLAIQRFENYQEGLPFAGGAWRPVESGDLFNTETPSIGNFLKVD